MFVRAIELTNIGPMQKVKIEPRFTPGGDPVPLALVGQNGAGKSLALSLILDAFTEARRQSFRELLEVGPTDYLRMSSKNYVRHSAVYSHAHVEISNTAHTLKFDELISRSNFDSFKAAASPEILALPNLESPDFKQGGFYKNLIMPEQAQASIRAFSMTYFPYFRYERPYWLSEKANVDFISNTNVFGIARYNPVRTNVVDETKRWILNLVLDRELYEKHIAPINLAGFTNAPNVFLGYDGPNDRVLSLINEIILAMLKSSDPSFIAGRIGIGRKGNRVLSIFGTREGQPEEVIAPEIDQLSSGQLMSLGLATEIIRAHELVSGSVPNQLNEVTGLALIDEVDLHLHINFQKTLLPAVLRNFPKVQFIMTTHSPFFLLGMAERGEIDIYNLPIGNRITPEEFSEFDAGYETFVKKNEQFRTRYKLLSEQVQISNRPLVITEGKTDWQHLKRALAKLRVAGEYVDLDIEFLEFDDPDTMGDEKLAQMCETSALLQLNRKLIFVFDRDNKKIINKMSGGPNAFRVVEADRVYSLCIPIPTHRNGYEKITIEMYYHDAELRTADPATGKRLWFSNEIQIVKHPTSGESEFQALSGPRTNEELQKWVFDEPADQIKDTTGQPVGLSKAAFITTIVDNDALAAGFDRTTFRAVFDVLTAITAPPAPAPVAS